MKNKKNITLSIVGGVLLILISFFIGTKFPQTKNVSPFSQNTNNPRGQMGGQFQGNGRVVGGNVFGKIISKDENSITVELSAPSLGNNKISDINANTNTQSGSKIVFYTNETLVTKTTNGNINDLSIGKNINIIGTTNSDGSVSATSVQIR